MKRFAKVVNSFYLTIFKKCFILDIWQGYEYAYVKITSHLTLVYHCGSVKIDPWKIAPQKIATNENFPLWKSLSWKLPPRKLPPES